MYDFNFDKAKEFFKNSTTIKFLKDELEKSDYLKLSVSDGIKEVSLQLFVESIIKHNLDINMTKVDHISLISNDNSELVRKKIGKIMFKEKDKRTDTEFKFLREQQRVDNALKLILLYADEKNDICKLLKDEYIEFKKLQLTESITDVKKKKKLN